MAAIVLGVVGQAVGPSLFGAGFSIFGASITGAAIGGALGSLVGSQIDNALFGGQHVTKQGPRLSDVNIQASTEGAAIPRIAGRMRLAGQLIWATKFKETATTSSQSTGGKGGPSTTVTSTDYAYSISFAVGLCAGEVHKLGRVWADGKVIDLAAYTTRFYTGSEDQDADPLIEEIEGAGNTPAYRGLCYIVFEDMPLAAFGNRIPQLQFELTRSITADNPTALENLLTGVTLIPGAGEFVYADELVLQDDGNGNSRGENLYNSDGVPDFISSMDDLDALAPNLETVSLVVGWFGDDLRAGSITIKPGVENDTKITTPQTWTVNGVARASAHVVSQIDGRPAYGGTPNDASVVQAIQHLRDDMGKRVVFYPFLFMDVASGNSLPNPYSNNAATNGQPAYPWRGRITCSPAAGYTGTVDKTATASTQINNFFGAAAASDLSVSGTTVSWTGGTDWGYRRMVLHYAKLCAAAGGVHAFIIGSELRGITRVRSASTTYPAVAKLKTLAADVKAIFTAAGQTVKIGYAADWSEYNNHQTGDAAGAVQFNLDPLWSDSSIDFIGIDNYMPLSDWRDGTAHLDYDAVNGPTSIYDIDYLQSNIRGGEDYDWFYASDADRASQTRTAITDGAGKPWVFRQKDLWNWWSNSHYDRVSGTESGSPTGWTPKSKPIWFTEIGCPAVNKGANQPNVFYDPKSSESFLPYFSNGERDDLMQRKFHEAVFRYWQDGSNNPDSDQYVGKMVDASNIFVWTWDARPYPFFPARSDIWGDAANYTLGHWLNGRLGGVLLADLVKEICEYSGFFDYDVSNLTGLVTGFCITSTMSARDAIEPLGVAYFFDGVETGGQVKFVMRGRAPSAVLTETDLVLPEGESGFGFTLNRAQETDLPVASRIGYVEATADYRQSVVTSKRLVGNSERVAESTLPIVFDQSQATGIGDRLIQDAWVMRETGEFALAPSMLALDPTDELEITLGGRVRRLRITEIGDAGARSMKTVATDPSIYDQITGPSRAISPVQVSPNVGRPLVVWLDIPMIRYEDNGWAPHVAAYANPWPGSVQLFKSATGTNYQLDTVIRTPANFGVLMYDFYSGPPWHTDRVNQLYVAMNTGTLQSRTRYENFINGTNALAIQNQDGYWEILQFEDAELIGPNQYKLTNFARGRRGTEVHMRNPVPAGARIVLLDENIYQTGLNRGESLTAFDWKWGPAGRDISDPTYTGANLQFEAVAAKPFAPCHVRFSWSLAGPDTGGSPMVYPDLVIYWIRRDRSLDARFISRPVTPMSENTESYAIEIMDGSTVKRSAQGVTAVDGDTLARKTSGYFRYTKAMQDADFPSGMPNPLVVNVYQLSDLVGRGWKKTEQIYWQ